MITAIVTLFAIIGFVACLLVANIIFRIIVGMFTIGGILIVAIGIVANSITIPIWLTLVVVVSLFIVIRDAKKYESNNRNKYKVG